MDHWNHWATGKVPPFKTVDIFISNGNGLLILIEILAAIQSQKKKKKTAALHVETKGECFSLIDLINSGKKKSRHFEIVSSPLPDCEWATPFFSNFVCMTIF